MLNMLFIIWWAQALSEGVPRPGSRGRPDPHWLWSGNSVQDLRENFKLKCLWQGLTGLEVCAVPAGKDASTVQWERERWTWKPERKERPREDAAVLILWMISTYRESCGNSECESYEEIPAVYFTLKSKGEEIVLFSKKMKPFAL